MRILYKGEVLFALTLALVGCYSHHDGVSRVEREIRALEAALESYKADNGHYPSDPKTTEQLESNSTFDPSAYVSSSEFLYHALSGDSDGRCYIELKSAMLRSTASGHTHIVDPWGNSYGYSTFKATHQTSLAGNNPTYDLWSTHDGKRSKDKPKWTTNW